MKNKLFYLIGVAHLLSYISTSTSYISDVNGKLPKLSLTNKTINNMFNSL